MAFSSRLSRLGINPSLFRFSQPSGVVMTTPSKNCLLPSSVATVTPLACIPRSCVSIWLTFFPSFISAVEMGTFLTSSRIEAKVLATIRSSAFRLSISTVSETARIPHRRHSTFPSMRTSDFVVESGHQRNNPTSLPCQAGVHDLLHQEELPSP